GLTQVLTEVLGGNQHAMLKLTSVLSTIKVCFFGLETVPGNLAGLVVMLLSCPWVPDWLIYCAVESSSMTDDVDVAATCCESLLVITEIAKVFKLFDIMSSLSVSIKRFQRELSDMINDLDLKGNMTDSLARVVIPLASVFCHVNNAND